MRLPLALDYLKRATDFLRERGVGNARLDAEVLLADVLGVDRVGVYLNFDRPLSDGEVARYREGVRRRGQREPLQHIRGRQEFFSRELFVDRRVLVPRPETETLVEEALRILRERRSARVLDVGTGSGAIAVTVALEVPAAEVVGVDASGEALDVAAANAHRLGARVEWRAGDLFEPVRGQRFDLVVSNPPYVPTREIGRLEPEVREFDPHTALDGGADGLEVVRRLVREAASFLAPCGWLALEVGAGQADEVARAIEAAGFLEVRRVRDLAGVERVVSARRGD